MRIAAPSALGHMLGRDVKWKPAATAKRALYTFLLPLLLNMQEENSEMVKVHWLSLSCQPQARLMPEQSPFPSAFCSGAWLWLCTLRPPLASSCGLALSTVTLFVMWGSHSAPGLGSRKSGLWGFPSLHPQACRGALAEWAEQTGWASLTHTLQLTTLSDHLRVLQDTCAYLVSESLNVHPGDRTVGSVDRGGR